jgi:hypothetical protein
MHALLTTVAERSPSRRFIPTRWTRLARPALGLILPATLAVVWEFVVRMGWSSGRLAPPPSVIFSTFIDLAHTGDLQRHTLVTLGRVAAGFGLGVVVATIVGAATGYSATLRRLLDPSLQALRAIPSIAWGTAVHSLARHFRSIESDIDRGRRFLSGLSGPDGSDSIGRSQAGRSRPGVSPI